jgi:DNA-binding transcriptional ArsR family regulator
MSGENWESLITEKGFMRVPRALRLKRAELGITNNEYTILLDYVDYYSFSGTMNPYRHLTEVSGMSERSIRKALTALEKKGLLRRKVSRHGNGRTNGVVFSIDPLLRKLRSIMKKSSPTVGEGIDPYVGEESVPPNTGEEFKKREEDKNTSVKNTDVRARVR